MAHDSFLELELAPESGGRHDDGKYAAPLPDRQGRPGEHQEQAGIDRMPDPSIWTVDDELMVMLDWTKSLQLPAITNRAQMLNTRPANVSAAPRAAGQIASGAKRSSSKGMGTCGAARRYPAMRSGTKCESREGLTDDEKHPIDGREPVRVE